MAIIAWVALMVGLGYLCGGGSTRLDPADIRFATAESMGERPTRFLVADDKRPIAEQLSPRQSRARRFNAAFTFDEPSPTPLAVFTPHLGSSATVYINNAKVGGVTARTYPLPGTGHQRAYYELPRFLLLPGRNRIDIYVEADPGRGGLGPMHLGDRDAVRRVHDRVRWVEDTLPAIAFWLALVAIGLNLGALVLTRHRTSSACLAIAAASLAWLMNSGSMAALVLLLLALCAAAAWIFRQGRLGPVRTTAFAVAIGGGLAGLSRVIGPVAPLGPSAAVIVLSLAALPVLIGLPAHGLVMALRERRSRVDTLEAALTDTRSVLEREIEQRAVFEERERLMRDIHDGVGGQLLGLLLRLRLGDLPREDIVRDVQGGLNDLRLVVDALDHTGNDLDRALVSFRERVTDQLDAAGLSLSWTQDGTLDMQPEHQDAVLNLYRLMQEALTNIVRHANASHVEVDIRAHRDAGEMHFIIRDDGVGRPDHVPDGRGTLNMRRRAELLGGKLDVVPGIDGRGHGLRLSLPIAATALSTG